MRAGCCVLVAAWLTVTPSVASSASAEEAMPVAQQNALVQTHCAVCHSDAARNGGLSLQHFDAAAVAPSLAAMMVSKLTSGLPIRSVMSASSDAGADAALGKRVMGGAINAAGVQPPSMAAVKALTLALASKAGPARAWHVGRFDDPATKTPTTTASLVREVARSGDLAESYRLTLTCNAASQQGDMQLAWAPAPRLGTLSTTADGAVRETYQVEGTEAMGNGLGASGGLAAIRITRAFLPSRALAVSDLFPNETVEFSFSDLPETARQSLAPCFRLRGGQ